MSVEKVSKALPLCISPGGTILIVFYMLWGTTEWQYFEENTCKDLHEEVAYKLILERTVETCHPET